MSRSRVATASALVAAALGATTAGASADPVVAADHHTLGGNDVVDSSGLAPGSIALSTD
jgi:hypothetical protein